MIQNKQLVPPLTLHGLDGSTFRAWDFKQKKNLVIVFLDGDCAVCGDFLRRLGALAGALRAAEAIALAVFLEPPSRAMSDRLPPEVIAGTDVPGRGVRAFLGEDALSSSGLVRRGVFCTDRYGELSAQWIVPDHGFPATGEILACLGYLENLC